MMMRMGWAYGQNHQGREIGYAVDAICDQPGCEAPIDRGLAAVCGGMHDGGPHGCGNYFCGAHLVDVGSELVPDNDGNTRQFCETCVALLEDSQEVMP